jgi:excisionase family DNA binding protein
MTAAEIRELAQLVAERLVQRSPASRLLKAEEVAERWQVPVAQIYRLTRDGRLPVVRIGRYYRYSVAAIEQFERDGGSG